MKAKELINQLSKLDPELDVLCYSEDETIQSPGHLFRLLDIECIETGVGEPVRGDDGVPSMKFEHSAASRKFVFVYVTPRF